MKSMARTSSHGFTSTTFYIWSGLLIWMANFAFVYVFAALACARGFADVRLFGFGVVPLTTVVSCTLAAVATGAVMWLARQRIQKNARENEHSNFIRFVVMATGLLALIAMLYVLLPPGLLTTHCSSGA